MPRDSAAADRPASYLVGTAAAFPLFFRDRTKPINQLPFSPSAKFPKSGSSCESRVNGITPHHSPVLFICRPVNITDMMIADEDPALFGGAHRALAFLKPAVDQQGRYRTPSPNI